VSKAKTQPPPPRPRRDSELKIGDLERLSGVSRSSIQHYVRLGLVPPPRKLGPKLFLFDTQHVEALEAVRRMRAEQRLPLSAIRARLRAGAAARPPAAPPRPRRDAILDAATRLFAERGFDGVRLADLGREIGLSKAALYRSFESKEALFIECIDRIRFLVVPQRQRAAGKRDPDLTRRALNRASAVLAHFDSYRMLTQLLLSVAHGRDRELARKARAAFHRMVTDVLPELQQAVKHGLYRDGELELDAYILWGALMGAGDFRAFVRADPVDAIARAYLDLMSLGMRPR